MDITYIFGNGFDIQCGLKSRYSDFLKEYTVIRDNDNNNIRAFKEYLSKSTSQELWSDAERAMGIHLVGFTDKNIEKYRERIVDFQFKMMDYLAEQQNKCIWTDRIRINQIFSNFVSRSYKDIISLRKTEFCNRMEQRNTYFFITFNYTDLIDNVVQYYTPFRTVYHVHGELSSSIIMGVNDAGQLNTGTWITLTDQLKKQLIKPEINGLINHRLDTPAMDVIRMSDVIAIYGVSFGETDNIWWEKIREWLESSTEHILIAFVKDKKKRNVSNCRLFWQIAEYENEKSAEILQKLGYRADHPQYDQLLQQVYTVPNTTRLNLKPIIMNDDPTGTASDKAAVSETASAAEMV